MARNFSNTAVQTTITAAISDSATTIPVTGVSGYPSTPFTAVLDPGTAEEELVEVTLVSGNNLTATRGIDGTPVAPHASGAVFAHVVSARDFSEPLAHVDATTTVHGIANTSSLVTLTGTQTLTNKTLTSPTIGGGTVNSATLVTPTIASFVNATHTHADDANGGTIGSGNTDLGVAYKRTGSGSANITADGTVTTGTALTFGTLAHSVGNTTWVTANSNTRILLPTDIATGYWNISAGVRTVSVILNFYILIVHEDLGVIASAESSQDDASGSNFHLMSVSTDFTSSAGKWVELRLGAPNASTSGLAYTQAQMALHRIA